MKALIVEDDFIGRMLLQRYLGHYGECHVAVHGAEAIQAFEASHAEKLPYQLICLDIMMPEMDGHTVLKKIRALETEMGLQVGEGAKIIMTTALKDSGSIFSAFDGLCDAYLVKPVDKTKLLEYLRAFNLIE